MKINVDPSLHSLQISEGERDTAGIGLGEQWLKALEQAHIEKQVAVFHSTGALECQETGSPDEQDSCQDRGRRHIGEPVTQRGMDDPCLQAAEIQPQGHEENMMAGMGPVCHEILPELLPWPQPPGNGTSIISGKATGGISRPFAAAPQQIDFKALQLMLPPSSVLTAIDTDKGVQIVIRDASLDADEVQRIIGKVIDVLSVQRRHLAAVILNGRCIWKSKGGDLQTGPKPELHQEQYINKIF